MARKGKKLIRSVERPCIKKCCLNENDVCLGCFRTLDDMRKWHKSSQEEKRKILSLAEIRKSTHYVSKTLSSI